MGSIAMDRQGNIGIGYSFGGTPHYPGQRFAARLAGDRKGVLAFQETILVEGEASQTTGGRWEDYTTTAIDPSDDCTFWYDGDYLKAGATTYSTRIGAFRLPGCLEGTARGTVFFDANHDGRRDAGEPGLAGRQISYAGGHSGKIATDGDGNFRVALPADAAYFDPTYTLTDGSQSHTVILKNREEATPVQFAVVCTIRNSGWRDARFWSGNGGKAVLDKHAGAYQVLVNEKLYLLKADGARLQVSGAGAYDQLRSWMRSARGPSVPLAAAAFNATFGGQDAKATIQDPVGGDWPTIETLIERVSAHIAASKDTTVYRALLEKLNSNAAIVTPATPAGCGVR
jgi:hypothetical protein